MKPNAWLEAWRQDIRRQLKRVGINKSSTPVVRVVISCERWRPNAEIWVGFMNPCLSWMRNDHDGCWKHFTNDDQGSLSHECWDGEPYIVVAHWCTNRIKQVANGGKTWHDYSYSFTIVAHPTTVRLTGGLATCALTVGLSMCSSATCRHVAGPEEGQWDVSQRNHVQQQA